MTPDPSPALLRVEARLLEDTNAYVAGVLRACARAWENERKERKWA
jgi:hypothetical protein